MEASGWIKRLGPVIAAFERLGPVIAVMAVITARQLAQIHSVDIN
jgi:hypothetical protein